MKQNKKGFTLIELLAVIVILAIIALIATPIILSMINNARKSAAKSSTLGFVDSIENYIGFYEANKGGVTGLESYDKPAPASIVVCKKTKSTSGNTTTYTWAADPSNADNNATCSAFYTAVEATTKGKAPETATVVISNGKVAEGSFFEFSGGTFNYDGTEHTGN